MDSIDCAKEKIRGVIAGSHVPEDPRHADNTLEWLLRLAPNADDALQLAALAHDIDRALEATKVKRADFNDYDAFKAAHASNGADILRLLLTECAVSRPYPISQNERESMQEEGSLSGRLTPNRRCTRARVRWECKDVSSTITLDKRRCVYQFVALSIPKQ